jgi:hypothetical protein
MKLLNAKSPLKLYLFISSLVTLSLLSFSAYADTIIKLDRIVAIVDKQAITEQELETKVPNCFRPARKTGEATTRAAYS